MNIRCGDLSDSAVGYVATISWMHRLVRSLCRVGHPVQLRPCCLHGLSMSFANWRLSSRLCIQP
ncbi:hypothetical protein D0N87_26140, partial [Pseudomonas sp. ATCC 13867]